MPSAAMSIWRCGASCAASTATRAPCRWATATISASGNVSPVTLLAAVTATSAFAVARARSAASNTPATSSTAAGASRCTTVPARHGNRLAWCSMSSVNTVVSGGSAPASRLSASVVLRVNTTWSSGRPPRNERTSVRGMLERFVAHRRREAGATVHAAVPRQQLGDGVGDHAQRRCAGRVVEVHGRRRPAGDERDVRRCSDHLQQRGDGHGGAGVVGDEGGHGVGLLWTRSHVGDGGSRLPSTDVDGRVVTRSTPPRGRVADQQAGATRWHS